MKRYLWLAVTADKYEFPIYIEDSCTKLANKLGISNCIVVNLVTQNSSGLYSGRKIIRVEV